MSNTTSVLLETELLILREQLRSYPVLLVKSVSFIFFVFCVMFFCFVCLRYVSYVQYCILGLSNFSFTIRDPLMFSYVSISNRRIDIQ
jgi:hypothetical protein